MGEGREGFIPSPEKEKTPELPDSVTEISFIDDHQEHSWDYGTAVGAASAEYLADAKTREEWEKRLEKVRAHVDMVTGGYDVAANAMDHAMREIAWSSRTKKD